MAAHTCSWVWVPVPGEFQKQRTHPRGRSGAAKGKVEGPHVPADLRSGWRVQGTCYVKYEAKFSKFPTFKKENVFLVYEASPFLGQNIFFNFKMFPLRVNELKYTVIKMVCLLYLGNCRLKERKKHIEFACYLEN